MLQLGFLSKIMKENWTKTMESSYNYSTPLISEERFHTKIPISLTISYCKLLEKINNFIFIYKYIYINKGTI